MTGCDVTSSFFVVGKRTVWKRVQESLEAQMFLTQLLHKNFNKFVIKYIFNDKVRTTLTEMIAKKVEKHEKYESTELFQNRP